MHASSEPIAETPENPNDISIYDAETQIGNVLEPNVERPENPNNTSISDAETQSGVNMNLMIMIIMMFM